jgi:hypothetical protein
MNAIRFLLTTVLVLGSAVALAEESAGDISKKSRDRGALNLVGLTAELKLVSTAADGKKREQVLTTTSKRIEGRSHVLARFSAPAGVAGVAVLTVEGEAGQGDEVSLFLPKLKRVRKVAKADRGKAFMDTDFAYADIAASGTRDEDLKRGPDDKAEGRDCFVLEGQGDDSSPYGKVRMLVDKETYVPMQVDYQDKSSQPFKRYRALKLKTYKGRVLAAESVMENLKTGSKTQLSVVKLEDATLADEAFTERALERG